MNDTWHPLLSRFDTITVLPLNEWYYGYDPRLTINEEKVV